MNIKQAKQEITNTLKAYLTRDEWGNYLIPTVRQRPILLMGPPGIGKTQIMEQIAAETGVGLVAYTITHHTRQSAIGLPFIEKRTYGGETFSVTEYTMSEILASVYQLMERTGLKEGILFLEGWTIVAAGNPPEYNKSVRDFDVVTLDRVKRIDVEEDFAVWKEYAQRKGIHGAVVSYLDIKKENFYRIETTVDGLQFATARGWEDLSELICAYEKLGLRVDRQVVGQYIQLPRIAKDFANYLELYYKYQRTYHVDEVLRGEWKPVTVSELRAAPFDEKLSVMGLLLSRMSESARAVRKQDALATVLHADLTEFKERLAAEPAQTVLEDLVRRRQAEMKRAREAGQLDKERRELDQREVQALETYRMDLSKEDITDGDAAMEAVRGWFAGEVEQRRKLGAETSAQFDNAFRFLEQAFGQGQELVIFVTEVTAGYDASWFVENFGCDAYFRHNKELLFDDRRRQIRADIAAAKAAQQEEEQHHA